MYNAIVTIYSQVARTIICIIDCIINEFVVLTMSLDLWLGNGHPFASKEVADIAMKRGVLILHFYIILLLFAVAYRLINYYNYNYNNNNDINIPYDYDLTCHLP